MPGERREGKADVAASEQRRLLTAIRREVGSAPDVRVSQEPVSPSLIGADGVTCVQVDSPSARVWAVVEGPEMFWIFARLGNLHVGTRLEHVASADAVATAVAALLRGDVRQGRTWLRRRPYVDISTRTGRWRLHEDPDASTG